jgi:hypothetical protein
VEPVGVPGRALDRVDAHPADATAGGGGGAGVVVLGEALNTGRAGIIALVTAALVMTAAIVKLPHVEAVATRNGVEARLQDRVSQPA